MSAKSPRGTLPLRRWLALALVSMFVVPAMVTGAFVWHVLGGYHQPESMAAARVRAGVSHTGVSEWTNPAWQAQTRADLAPQGVDFVLYENGREVYRTSADPLGGLDGAQRTRTAQTLVIPTATGLDVAFIYADQRQGPPTRRFWLVPVVGFGALLLTLAGIAWFLGRTVVRPLAATSDAARRVAAGDLDVALPSSRVREVAELDASFETMSADLRASLHQQAALEQERRFFIGAIVHDLRTPLFSLRGYLEGLQKGLADTPEKRARYVSVAQEKAAALERLISDLFDYTRLEYLDQAPNREPLDFGALLRRLVDELQPQARTKGVDLALAAPSSACVVNADLHLLTRAVENLLDNALRYTPGGGTIRVASHATPDRVTFSIADTGPGIPAHDVPHLFAPLDRGETSRNRRTGGAGLGLTIARRILLAHGGDLTARNGAEGGAIFAGTLPAPGPSASPPDASSGARPAEELAESRR